MPIIFKILKRELSRFSDIPQRGRKLTLSIMLYLAADIISWIFSMAYLYSKTQRFETTAVFDLGLYLTICLGFLINSKLISRFSSKKITTLGLSGMGLVFLILFLIPWLGVYNSKIDLITSFVLGLMYGLPCGLYWSNRLFLFTTEVRDQQRDYVSAVTGAFASISGVVLPLLVGWLIALSPALGWEKLVTYRWIMVVAFLLYFFSGKVLSSQSSTSQ
ncbi:MAG: hypothetical protein ACOZAN_03000 [Patescibacteria group bacterium]